MTQTGEHCPGMGCNATQTSGKRLQPGSPPPRSKASSLCTHTQNAHHTTQSSQHHHTTPQRTSVRAASATPCAWLPAEEQITPASSCSLLSCAILLYAPRSLKDLTGCRSSRFSRMRLPLASLHSTAWHDVARHTVKHSRRQGLRTAECSFPSQREGPHVMPVTCPR